MRQYEPVQCANLDLALLILGDPRSTFAQRLFPGFYVGLWTSSHAGFVVGASIATAGGVVAWGQQYLANHPETVQQVQECAGQAWELLKDRFQELVNGINIGANSPPTEPGEFPWISTFTPEDADALLRFAETVKVVHPEHNYTEFSEHWQDLANTGIADNNLLLAHVKGQVTGAMELDSIPYSDKNFGGDALLIRVLEALGSGPDLMRAAYRESLQRGYGGSIALFAVKNPKVIEFYERFPGYVRDFSTDLFYWSAEAAKKAFGP